MITTAAVLTLLGQSGFRIEASSQPKKSKLQSMRETLLGHVGPQFMSFEAIAQACGNVVTADTVRHHMNALATTGEVEIISIPVRPRKGNTIFKNVVRRACSC